MMPLKPLSIDSRLYLFHIGIATLQNSSRSCKVALDSQVSGASTYQMRIENEATFKASLTTDINLFAGAGFSVLAKNAKGDTIPIGKDLVEELCSEFVEPNLRDQPLSLVSQVVKSKDRFRFNEFLLNRFTISEFDERYNCIKDLNISRIFTTNIDDLFNSVFHQSDKKYLNDLILQGGSFRDRSAVEFLPLHGSVTYPEPDFTFTPIEIASAFAHNPTQFQYLVTCLIKSPTLFVGYSLQDAGTLQSLNSTFTSGPNQRPRWIQLREANFAAEAYFHSLGFNIIIGETDEFLDYLSSISVPTPVSGNTIISSASFNTGRIPTLRETPVRPLTDYFRGHAPIWHDVLANRVPTTSKYYELINAIDAGRHVILTGIPVSGKSTLLMQAAAYHSAKAVKLFEDSITVQKANTIVNIVSGKGSLIIFVDNLADSIEALDTLTSCKDIQVIGADRTVNIGFGSHRFKLERFFQLDCSDLSQADYTKIFEAIPPAIRKDRIQIPRVESQFTPSTFEFIERNVKGPSISDRYRAVLGEMKNRQIDIHDLFVMICYVFTCHAPVSFDVVNRFIDARGDYIAVYEAIKLLGRLLSDIDTADQQFIDLTENQDYFAPRSLLVAETVVGMCRNDDFGRIYRMFHNRVPRLFIPRFAQFRRYGYRSAFVDRVFSDWRDGEEFYLKSYYEDKTFYHKQQLALFLGGRRQYELAFKYIDEALIESRNQNPNVRHTHARLLFDANIEKAYTDSSLRGNLRRSMEILEACHEYDRRQTNHALRFAEQSIKYKSIFPGDEADTYMHKARGWLVEEINKSRSLRPAKRLLREIELLT